MEMGALPALLPASPAQWQPPTAPAASLAISSPVIPAISAPTTAQFATLLAIALPVALATI